MLRLRPCTPSLPPQQARPALTQQRMMSQSASAGASVFTAFLQAWESETRKPACRRADLGTRRECKKAARTPKPS